jgi:hypothetical protein
VSVTAVNCSVRVNKAFCKRHDAIGKTDPVVVSFSGADAEQTAQAIEIVKT